MQCIPKISIKYDEETFFSNRFQDTYTTPKNYETACIKGVKKKKIATLSSVCSIWALRSINLRQLGAEQRSHPGMWTGPTPDIP